MESWICSGCAQHRQTRGCEVREGSGTALQSSICYYSPPSPPQNPSQETWQVWALLWKSQDRTESSELLEQLQSSRHEPTRLLERCQASRRRQSPLSAFLGTTLWFPSPRLIPTSVPGAWAAPGFVHWKSTSECDGARRGTGGVPLLPCLQTAAAPPWKRCQLRELAGSCPIHKSLWASANPPPAPTAGLSPTWLPGPTAACSCLSQERL